MDVFLQEHFEMTTSLESVRVTLQPFDLLRS